MCDGENRALRRLAQIQSDRAVSEEAGQDADCGAPALSLISLMCNRGDDTQSSSAQDQDATLLT